MIPPRSLACAGEPRLVPVPILSRWVNAVELSGESVTARAGKGMKTVRARGFLTRCLINAIILLLIPYVMGPAVQVSGVLPALLGAFVLGIVNALIRPILIILSLPIQLLTLGLFTFVINGFMLWVVARLVGGFYIAGFWPAVLASILLSIGSSVLSFLVRDRAH